LGRIGDGEVYLKTECWQRTGSFKERGAVHKLAELGASGLARGVVTASAGNHGLGVAYATQALGLPPATIFVPENTPATKQQRLGEFPCHLVRAGADYDSTHAVAEAFAREHGALYLSAYDDPVVIAGQGTAGLEALDDLPDADIFLVPVGGGGLIAGVAVVAKAANPNVRVVGLQPEASPAAKLSLQDGRAYEAYPAGPTICDGLAGGFGRLPFEIAGELIDDILIVSENEVRRSVAWLLLNEQIVAEGSGAIAIAPLLSGELNLDGRKAVAVLTGRNIDASLLQEVLAEYPDP
jgi:threonine dehydratase